MIRLYDPPRLRESAETPRELREWLAAVITYEPSVAEGQWLIRVVDGIAGQDRSKPEPIRTTQPTTVHAAGVGTSTGTGKLFASVMIGLVVIPIGVYGCDTSSHHQPFPSSVQSQLSAPPIAAYEEAASATRQSTGALPSVGKADARATAATSRALDERGPQQRSTTGTRGAIKIATATRVTSEVESRTLLDAPEEPAASAQEWRILRAARGFVTKDPDYALAFVQQHAQRFPQGMLCQERETIAIDALARLGRAGEAQARAKTFSTSYPASPYRSRNNAAAARSVKLGRKP